MGGRIRMAVAEAATAVHPLRNSGWALGGTTSPDGKRKATALTEVVDSAFTKNER